MKQFLEKLKKKQDLSFEESKSVFNILMNGEATEEEITGHWVGGQMCYDTSHWCKTCLAYELEARAEELLKEIILEGVVKKNE